MDLANSKELSVPFRGFAGSYLTQDLRPSARDVAPVLQNLTSPLWEPTRNAEERFLSHKTLFLTALASAKRVRELHALSYHVSHSVGGKRVSFSFVPGSVVKTQDQSSLTPRFEKFTVLTLPQSSSSPKGRILCPVRTGKCTWTAPPFITREGSDCSSSQDTPERRPLRTLSPSAP